MSSLFYFSGGTKSEEEARLALERVHLDKKYEQIVNMI